MLLYCTKETTPNKNSRDSAVFYVIMVSKNHIYTLKYNNTLFLHKLHPDEISDIVVMYVIIVSTH